MAGPELDKWIAFFQSRILRDGVEFTYASEIDHIVNTYSKKNMSLNVDYMDLHRFDDEWAEGIIENPEQVLPVAEAAIYELCPADAKCAIRFRPYHFLEKSNLFDVKDIPGKLVSVEAMVRTVRQKKKMCTRSIFRCGKCGNDMQVFQEDPREWREPFACGNESCGRGPNQTTFKFIPNESEFLDLEIDAIEDMREVVKGPEPYQYEAIMSEDLCQKIVPGQRVVITGIVRLRQKTQGREKFPLFEPYLWAVSIESLDERYDLIVLSNDDIEEIKAFARKPTVFEDMRKMIAPFIFGLDDIKMAIALQLFGGVEKSDGKGYRVRSDIHILLIGDPGAGKSQILKHVATISPRGIYCSGKSASGAGLTAACSKEGDGGWIIIAGALAIADRGQCNIDEIDKMGDDDRGSIHEAMEQQTISVTKVAKAQLFCRCSILAAANPKGGRFDDHKPLIQQVDMDPVLLSRFGLIYVLTDDVDENIDGAKAEYIMNYAQDLAKVSTGMMSPEIRDAQQRLKLPMTYDFLKKYIAYAKQNVLPVISDDVKNAIRDYYVLQRQEGAKDAMEGEHRRVTMTTRQIEDLTRLTEASARLRLSDVATMEDVDRAIMIHQSCVSKIAKDPAGKLDIDLITTGISARGRDMASTMIDIIAKESRNYKAGVPEEELIQFCVSNNIFSDERAREILRSLHTSGDILLFKDKILLSRR